MESFNKLSLLEKRKMAIEELVNYYAEYRIYLYNNGSELKGIELRKKIHFLCDLILKIDQVLSRENNIIIANESHVDKNSPKIFACTHIGGNDIQRTFQVIKDPAYLMLGDPGILYKMPIYQALKLNGVIPLETKNRTDRKIAYNRSVELLNKGGNLLIYPEGAWNVSANELVMKTYVGTVRMAKETGFPIVPIAVEQYGKTFYFNIGECYTIDANDPRSEKELNLELRDKLCTLKWEILETQPVLKHEYIPTLEEFQSEIIERCNYGYGFSLEDALSESFHDKTIISEEEIFKCLENVELNTNNAFLAKQLVLKK